MFFLTIQSKRDSDGGAFDVAEGVVAVHDVPSASSHVHLYLEEILRGEILCGWDWYIHPLAHELVVAASCVIVGWGFVLRVVEESHVAVWVGVAVCEGEVFPVCPVSLCCFSISYDSWQEAQINIRSHRSIVLWPGVPIIFVVLYA